MGAWSAEKPPLPLSLSFQWFGQFFDEKVPFSEIGIMDNQVNDTPHTERRH